MLLWNKDLDDDDDEEIRSKEEEIKKMIIKRLPLLKAIH